MSTVHCPHCRRALRLPDFAEVEQAQCPLCGTIFDASAWPAQNPPHPVRSPSPPDQKKTSDFWPIVESNAPEHKALRRAAAWLQLTGLLGILHPLCCGCLDLLDPELPRAVSPRPTLLLVVFSLLGRFLVGLIIWSASEALKRRRSLTHSWLGATLAIILGIFLLFRAVLRLPQMFLADSRGIRTFQGEGELSVLLGFVNLSLSLVSIAAGLICCRILSRADVRALFLS